MRHIWSGFLLSLALTCGAETYSAKATQVSDGDTLWVKPDAEQAPRKLRLLGIDAPELCQSGGKASRVALWQLVHNQSLLVRVDFADSYGRGLASIKVGGRDVAAAMVSAGQAWSSDWQHRAGPYAQQEAQARSAGLGLFAQTDAELPRVFRKRYGSCYPKRG